MNKIKGVEVLFFDSVHLLIDIENPSLNWLLLVLDFFKILDLARFFIKLRIFKDWIILFIVFRALWNIANVKI